MEYWDCILPRLRRTNTLQSGDVPSTNVLPLFSYPTHLKQERPGRATSLALPLQGNNKKDLCKQTLYRATYLFTIFKSWSTFYSSIVGRNFRDVPVITYTVYKTFEQKQRALREVAPSEYQDKF